MIYLATPYSHSDQKVVEERFDMACRIAGALMDAGWVVFSPIAHTHPIAVRCNLPKGWEYWRQYDEEMLQKSDAIVIAMMDGWLDSKGVAGEVEIAKMLEIPIHVVPVETLLAGKLVSLKPVEKADEAVD